MISHVELWPWRVVARGTERRDTAHVAISQDQPRPGAHSATGADEAEMLTYRRKGFAARDWLNS
jgi:hypothetical protein